MTEHSQTGAVSTDERALAEWIKDTCLFFGTTVETAYRVAAMFVEGLKHNLEKTHASV